MHDPYPLETFIIGNGNERACSLPTRKIALGSFIDGSGSFKFKTTLMSFNKLGIESTTTNPTPQRQSVEGKDWVVLQPKPSPSRKLLTKKGQVALKFPLRFGVIEGAIGQIIGHASKLPTTF
jgi:hypothetical protein